MPPFFVLFTFHTLHKHSFLFFLRSNVIVVVGFEDIVEPWNIPSLLCFELSGVVTAVSNVRYRYLEELGCWTIDAQHLIKTHNF